MIDINPRNRKKSKFYFILRTLEDYIKNFFLLIIIFISFFYKTNPKKKLFLDLGNYKDIYSINYIVFSLSSKYIFTYNFSSCLKLFRRLGLVNFFKSCKPNFLLKEKKIKIFYNKKSKLEDNELNFNFDYFKPFDLNKINNLESKKELILPYYAKSNFYKKNLFKKYLKLRNKKKTIQILFSGSSHTDWYDQLKWQTSFKNKTPIMTRTEILNFVKNEFKNDVQIVYDKTQISEINYNKKILFIISDPSKKRKLSKLLSIDEHMNFVASAKFFLTSPGTAMPLCHHIIESIFLGSIPITSYGHLLQPNLNQTNSISFSNQSELYESIKKALIIGEDQYNKMHNNVINYYDLNLSSSSFLKFFESLSLPSTLYMNVDGHTLDSRRERFGLSRLFPSP